VRGGTAVAAGCGLARPSPAAPARRAVRCAVLRVDAADPNPSLPSTLLIPFACRVAPRAVLSVTRRVRRLPICKLYARGLLEPPHRSQCSAHGCDVTAVVRGLPDRLSEVPGTPNLRTRRRPPALARFMPWVSAAATGSAKARSAPCQLVRLPLLAGRVTGCSSAGCLVCKGGSTCAG
jgi:hypothetical protein